MAVQDEFVSKDTDDEESEQEEDESEEDIDEEDEATTTAAEDDAYMRRLAREAAKLAVGSTCTFDRGVPLSHASLLAASRCTCVCRATHTSCMHACQDEKWHTRKLEEHVQSMCRSCMCPVGCGLSSCLQHGLMDWSKSWTVLPHTAGNVML